MFASITCQISILQVKKTIFFYYNYFTDQLFTATQLFDSTAFITLT